MSGSTSADYPGAPQPRFELARRASLRPLLSDGGSNAWRPVMAWAVFDNGDEFTARKPIVLAFIDDVANGTDVPRFGRRGRAPTK